METTQVKALLMLIFQQIMTPINSSLMADLYITARNQNLKLERRKQLETSDLTGSLSLKWIGKGYL